MNVEDTQAGHRADHDHGIVLEATLALSQTQLLAQIADETSLDGRTMGLLGFSGALLAVDVAAKDAVGTWWWTPLPFILAAAALCLRSIFSQDTFLGPEAPTFYTAFGSRPANAARTQLLTELYIAFEANSSRAREKATALRWALVILFSGMGIALGLTVI